MTFSHVEERKCTKCKTVKPISEFYQNARGNTQWCKECLRELSRQRVKDGRDRESKLKYEAKHNVVREPRKRLTDLEKCVRELYHNLKKRSIYLMPDKPFDITKEWLQEQVTDFCKNNYHVLAVKSPFKPSVDRIDNKNGYTQNNVRIIWLIENYCRNTFTDEEVIEFCKRKLGLL